MKIQIIWEGSLLTEILQPQVKTYRTACQSWKVVNIAMIWVLIWVKQYSNNPRLITLEDLKAILIFR